VLFQTANYSRVFAFARRFQRIEDLLRGQKKWQKKKLLNLIPTADQAGPRSDRRIVFLRLKFVDPQSIFVQMGTGTVKP